MRRKFNLKEKMASLEEGGGKTDFIISAKELEDAFPQLYDVYKRVLGGKRGNINVEVEEEYLFAPDKPDTLSDYFVNEHYAILRDGKVLEYDTAGTDDKMPPRFKFKLDPGMAVLEINYSYHGGVTLYVGPSFVVPRLSGNNDDLTLPEKAVLMILYYTASFARLKQFSHPYINMDGKAQAGNSQFSYDNKELHKQIKEMYPGVKTMDQAYLAIAQTLAQKELARVSSNGSVAITNKGKNKAIEIDEQAIKEKYGK